MISHEARQVVEKASHEAMVEKASHEAMAKKGQPRGEGGKGNGRSNRFVANGGGEWGGGIYLPPSSKLLVAKGQKNDAQRQLLQTYKILKISSITMKLTRIKSTVTSKGSIRKTTEPSTSRVHSRVGGTAKCLYLSK
jgi:hypothetical protein